MTESELEARIRALGRPEAVFAPLPALMANIREKAAWDAANPVLRDEYFRLVGQLVELRDAAKAAADEVERANRSMRRLRSSGVGDRSLEAADEPEETPALGAVRRFLANDKTWLVLLGAKGCGKTVAATWAVRERVLDGHSAAFRRVSEVGKLSAFEAGAEELARLAKVELLVLDELGTEFASDFARAQFHELLDKRHEAKLKTILTSNLPAPEVKQRLGERIADRIEGSGGVVQIGGGSLRRVS